jgi:hypothetical protein
MHPTPPRPLHPCTLKPPTWMRPTDSSTSGTTAAAVHLMLYCLPASVLQYTEKLCGPAILGASCSVTCRGGG